MSSYGVPVNPVSTNLLNTLWPAYALTGPATSSNYFNTDPQQGHSHNGLVKIDHNFNERNRISARAYFAYGFQVGTIGDNIVYYYAVTPVHSQNYNVTYNTTVNAHLENQLLFGDNFFSLAKQDQNLSFNPPALGLNTGVTAANLSGSPYINIGSFRFECSFYTWIYRIVTNLCLDHLRKRSSRYRDLTTTISSDGEEEQVLDRIPDQRAGSSPERNMASSELRGCIVRAMQRLSPRERMVFELKHYHGLRLRTVAGILNTSEGTIKNTLFRATHKLRTQLATVR